MTHILVLAQTMHNLWFLPIAPSASRIMRFGLIQAVVSKSLGYEGCKEINEPFNNVCQFLFRPLYANYYLREDLLLLVLGHLFVILQF